MLKQTPRLSLTLLLLASALTANAAAARAQSAAPSPVALASARPATAETDRDRDGLQGAVRRVRTENAKLVFKEGKMVEGQHNVLETATYDIRGAKIDNAYFLSAGGALTGREVYKYDDKGNIVEMTLFNTDGSVLSKEKYDYEFDAMGNWTKMLTSVAVVENGKMSFELTEVTFRFLAYFLEDNVTRKLQTPAPPIVNAAANAPVNAPANVSANAAAPKQQPPPPANAPKKVGALPALSTSASNATSAAPISAPTAQVSANAGAPVVRVEDDMPPPKPAAKAPVRPVSGGVLNGRATSLPAPVYPEIARRMRTTGVVTIEVVVDASGRVISAKAVSGPDVLRAAAERAAMMARFSPALLSGQPVKMSGTINYNFML